jgi:hypothetical protein
MEKPVSSNYHYQDNSGDWSFEGEKYKYEWDKYEKHIASLPEYLVIGEVDWEDQKELDEGKDFIKRKQIAIFEDSFHEANFETIVAIPMSTGKPVDRNIIEFLLGEKSYVGVWFGDNHQKKIGNYWWRSNLRKYLSQLKEEGVLRWVKLNNRKPNENKYPICFKYDGGGAPIYETACSEKDFYKIITTDIEWLESIPSKEPIKEDEQDELWNEVGSIFNNDATGFKCYPNVLQKLKKQFSIITKK